MIWLCQWRPIEGYTVEPVIVTKEAKVGHIEVTAGGTGVRSAEMILRAQEPPRYDQFRDHIYGRSGYLLPEHETRSVLLLGAEEAEPVQPKRGRWTGWLLQKLKRAGKPEEAE